MTARRQRREGAFPATARGVALRALTATAAGERLDHALEAALGTLPEARDRALARALSYGTCRHWHRLDALLGHLLSHPIRRRDRGLHVLLLLGLHQVLDLRVPAHAAVNESVELARRIGHAPATRLVNAVLRRALREPAALEGVLAENEAARLSHPDWLLDAFRTDWPEDYARIATANNQQGPMTLRVNRLRGDRDSYLGRLREHGHEAATVAGLPDALTLAEAVDVHALPGFDEGAVSVQDAAAQLAAGLLAPPDGSRVLDACAAPGGKTAHLLETAPGIGELVAVERSAARLQRLESGLERLGLRERVTCIHDDALALAERFPEPTFDAILLDAPCSASGVIRRHPDIKLRRTAEQIEAVAGSQRALLAALWPLLARGGTLLYATCSVLAAENGEVMQDFLAAHPDAQCQPLSLPVGCARGTGYQILPGDADMDGFFYARLRKT